MTKKNTLILSILISLFFIQCQKTSTDFLITADSVGKLKRDTTVSDLETIFVTDSVVRDTSTSKLRSSTKRIQIYEKGGQHLLTLTPSTDSIPKIENIRIMDSRFVTEKGIGFSSTFKEIKDNYDIKNTITTMNNVVIYLKDSDMYFTISKEELPTSLRYAASSNVEAVQIPDEAKVKYFMVGW
ncbi:hypothetical protein [Spongiimicrobium salis]|uniref:hypothetical protein n=1 Tax=Spongiimicrobium salis TaxID=1667022 RepID=UPI00374D5501